MKWTHVACIAGIAARIACVLAGPGAVRTDAIAYRDLARSLAAGHGYPGAHWMPGWPAWMSLFFRAGLGERGVVFGNAMLGIVTIFLAAKIARELGRNEDAAAAICALTPSLATMPRLLVSENLAVPLFALATWLLVRATKGTRAADWIAFGAATAAAVWVREASLALVLAGVFVALSKKRFSGLAVFAVTVALALAPWVARNRGSLTTSAGASLCIGLGEGATGGYRVTSDDRGIECVKGHPLSIVTLAPAKLARLFAFDDWTADDFFAKRPPSRTLRVLCNVFWWALCAFAVAGAVRAPSREILAVIGSVALASIITFGVGRFHAPVVPLLAVLTCYRRAS